MVTESQFDKSSSEGDRRMKRLSFWAVAASLPVLTACGGGGGSSSTLSPFSGWNEISQPNQSFLVSGVALETSTVSDPVTDRVISFANPGETSATLTGGLNAQGNGLSSVTVASNSGLSSTFTSGIEAVDGVIFAESSDGLRDLTLINPYDLDWNYQTFGFWSVDQDLSRSTAGAFSVGAVTSSVNMPVTGVATYTGLGAGWLGVVGAEVEVFASLVTAQTDFRLRTINLSSITFEGPLETSFSGSLIYSSGSTSFSGSVSTLNQSMTGTASGRFYGSAAEEMGGVFWLTGQSAGQSAGILGGFGAQR